MKHRPPLELMISITAMEAGGTIASLVPLGGLTIELAPATDLDDAAKCAAEILEVLNGFLEWANSRPDIPMNGKPGASPWSAFFKDRER